MTLASLVGRPQQLKKIENLSGYIAIGDFVSNYVFRFEQDDGQLAFPYKVGGKYHMLNKVTVCSKESLTVALDRLKNIFGLLTGPKICLPPLVRYLYTPCCDAEGHCDGIGTPTHASELMAKCQEVRKQVKNYFAGKPGNIRVPDLMQCMFPDCTNMGSLAAAVGQVSAPDGVHLTKVGYGKVAEVVIETIKNQNAASIFVSGPKGGLAGGKPKSFFWRGFSSPVGTERPRENYFSNKYKHVGKMGSRLHPTGRGGEKIPTSLPVGQEAEAESRQNRRKSFLFSLLLECPIIFWYFLFGVKKIFFSLFFGLIVKLRRAKIPNIGRKVSHNSNLAFNCFLFLAV